MSITVVPFGGPPQKPEFFADLMEAMNRAKSLAKEHQKEYALYGEDHDLECVVMP